MFLGMAVSFRYVEKHFPQKYADQVSIIMKSSGRPIIHIPQFPAAALTIILFPGI